MSNQRLFFRYYNFLNFITLTDLINGLYTFHNLAKAGMVAVEVRCVVPTVTNKKLRSSGISSGMGHRENTPVVVLVVAIQFTINGVTGSTCACSVRTTTLDHKIGNNTVKCQSIIKPLFR